MFFLLGGFEWCPDTMRTHAHRVSHTHTHTRCLCPPLQARPTAVKSSKQNNSTIFLLLRLLTRHRWKKSNCSKRKKNTAEIFVQQFNSHQMNEPSGTKKRLFINELIILEVKSVFLNSTKAAFWSNNSFQLIQFDVTMSFN